MRKLVVHTLVSLDGVVDDPPGWGSRDYKDDESLRDDLGEILACDVMLLGRYGYETLFPIFSPRTDPWAMRMNAMDKRVFSSTLGSPAWHNTKVVPGDPLAAVETLKRAGGGDLLIYGYTRLAQSLLGAGLVDVLRVSIHPVLVGRGRQLFREGFGARLTLAAAKTYSKGVVMLTYGKA